MNFPEKVIKLVSVIPAGRILNYGQVAILLGNPKAARAVGYALAALPAGTEVPWHRVVGKDGKVGKVSLQSSKYIEAEQQRRLESEGIIFDESGYFPLQPYLWQLSHIEVQAILGE